MKKLFLTSVIIALAIYPSYSTTVTGSGTECTEETLNTDTGPATLQAQWTANTITLEWYNGETKITPSNGTANTCTYDSSITLPTNNPTKEGYTFSGWRVRQAVAQLFNLSTLSSYIDTNGSGYAYIQFDGIGSTPNPSGTRKTPDTYNLSTPGEWATNFSYGTVKGIARCSTVGSGYTQGQTGNPTDDLDLNNFENGAKYCWCQPTGFDAEKDGTYSSVASPSWVFRYDNLDADGCAGHCENDCASSVRSDSDFRRALFGVSQ